jgi:hypothetical protein
MLHLVPVRSLSDRCTGHGGSTYLTAEMRFGERPVEANGIVALHQPHSKGRRHEVLDPLLLFFRDVLSLDDLGDVLGYRRIGSCISGKRAHAASMPRLTNTVLVHESDEIRLGKKVRSRCRPFLELANRGHELLSFLEVWQIGIGPLVIRIHIEVVSPKNDES